MSEPGPAETTSDRLPPAAHRVISWQLRIGLVVSLVLIVTFLALYAARNDPESLDHVVAHNPILSFLSGSGLLAGLVAFRPEAYLTVGVLVLIATPVLRVATGLHYFHQNRERSMALVTGTVLALLLLGLFVFGPLIR